MSIARLVFIFKAAGYDDEKRQAIGMKINKSAIWICAVVVVYIASLVAGKMIGKGLSDKAVVSGNGAFLSRLEAGIEEKLPIEVDSNTTLVSVYTKENFFAYQYRLKNIDTSMLDVNVFKAEIRKGLTPVDCRKTSMGELLIKGVEVAFVYYPEQGNDIFADIRLTKKDCAAEPDPWQEFKEGY